MCIILYKPANANFPAISTIKTCFENNPDGAGLLIFENQKAKIEKGLMTFNDLKKALKRNKLNNDSHFAIHFRIATSGKVNQKNCHPFPISSNEKALQKLNGVTSQAIMHNGVIGKGEGNLSDTQVFTRDTLNLLSPYFHDECIRDHIENLLGSDRMLIFSDGKIYLLNHWIIDQGIYYSNDSFEYKYIPFRRKISLDKKENDYFDYLDYIEEIKDDDFAEYLTEGNSKICEYCSTEMYNSGNSDMLICSKCGNMVSLSF